MYTKHCHKLYHARKAWVKTLVRPLPFLLALTLPETVLLTGGAADYDGALPVRVFAALCAGKPVTNAADAENGARVTEALDAMYRSARSGRLEQIGGQS